MKQWSLDARSEGQSGHSPLRWREGRNKKTGLAIPSARATRGRGLPSLDARTMETRQAAPLIMEGKMEIAFGKLSRMGIDRLPRKT
jgi:hypothetical protein